MIRTLLCLALAACQDATMPARNLVCERVSLLSPSAACSPELSGVGELSTHTARVTVSGQDGKPVTLVCGLNAGQLSMACGPMEVAPQPKAESK